MIPRWFFYATGFAAGSLAAVAVVLWLRATGCLAVPVGLWPAAAAYSVLHRNRRVR